jgi:hypothetical protein
LQAHGGDCLKFAGDALICCWPLPACADSAADAAAAGAAAACALALLHLEASAPPGDEPPLSLHIALHCGQLSEFHVGNGDVPGGRWEHIVAGAPLAELAPLIAAAAPGECVASDAVWALLRAGGREAEAGARCAGGATLSALVQDGAAVSDAAPLVLSGEALVALGCYLPPALADTLHAGEQCWLAELRHVSVLFLLLPPCGADDFALAQALVAEVHRCALRYGGVAQQSLVDDKGTVSICVWGKPPDSHADDPRRAVAAACELATSLRRIAAAHGRDDDIISCGVTTGRAFCGNVGSSSRCDWSIVGDAMNNAARLMASAASLCRPVLCCAVTARHVRASLAEQGDDVPLWLDATPLVVTLKGTEAPMLVYAPCPADDASSPRRTVGGLPRRARIFRRDESFGSFLSNSSGTLMSCCEPDLRRSPSGAALLGRDAELARVAAMLETGSDSGADDGGGGGGPVIVVSGGVSCGKTAFLRAAAVQACAAGRAVLPLRVGGGDGGFDTPWFAAAVEAHVESLPATLRPLAPLLTQLVPSAGINPAELATPASGAALAALEEPQAALCALAVEVLRPVTLAAGGAVVLLSDDASTLDELSCALLTEVHARLAPALLLALPRAELEDADSGGARLVSRLSLRASTCRTCTLGPLPPPAVAQLCASVLDVPLPALPLGLVPALMRLAGGHPLLLKEQLTLLLRQGHLVVDPERRSVLLCADLGALPGLIARSLTDEHGVARLEIFMQRRLDSLGPAGRTAVRAAAVLGAAAVFDLPLIAAACAPRISFGAVCAAAAELVHEGMWTHAPAAAVACGGGDDGADGADDESGAACYVFSHEVVRSLVFAATPEDVRAELHAAVLARLQERAEAGACGGGCADHPQLPAVWAEWGRLARGAHAHMQAARLFRTAAQVSIASATAGSLLDAARSARDGVECLRDAARADAGGGQRQESPRHSSASSASSSPRSSMRASQQHAAAPRLSEPELRAAAATAEMRRRDSVPANPVHAALLTELTAVLDTVARVQSSWAAVEARLDEVAAAMAAAFVARAPALLHAVRGKRGDALAAPDMRAILLAHQVTLLRLVGTTVAGERDLQALAPTLLQCGRMHARFGPTVHDFYPALGDAMADALRSTLGAQAFAPNVEAAWAAVYSFVAKHMILGIDQAARTMEAEASLRHVLGGTPAAMPVAILAAVTVAAAAC